MPGSCKLDVGTLEGKTTFFSNICLSVLLKLVIEEVDPDVTEGLGNGEGTFLLALQRRNKFKLIEIYFQTPIIFTRDWYTSTNTTEKKFTQTVSSTNAHKMLIAHSIAS